MGTAVKIIKKTVKKRRNKKLASLIEDQEKIKTKQNKKTTI